MSELSPRVSFADPEQAAHVVGTPAMLLWLQQSAGNAAVARLLKTDRPEAVEGTAGAQAGTAGEAAPSERAEAPEDLHGHIEDLEGEELDTRGCDTHARTRDPGSAVRRVETLPAPSAGVLPVRASIEFEGRAERDTSLDGGKGDSVAGHLSLGNKIRKGGAKPGGGEFGVEKVKYKIDKAKWSVDKALSQVDVSARIFLNIGWGVHSLGRTNVSGPKSSAVKKKTWSDLVTDLTPDGTGRPNRNKYWCKDLTEKHEQFHASDDIGRAALYQPTAEAWLGSQTVAAPAVGKAGKKQLATDVKALLETARGNVEADGWAWYGTGGEDRAYADGMSSYQARVDAITNRATSAGW